MLNDDVIMWTALVIALLSTSIVIFGGIGARRSDGNKWSGKPRASDVHIGYYHITSPGDFNSFISNDTSILDDVRNDY